VTETADGAVVDPTRFEPQILIKSATKVGKFPRVDLVGWI